MIQFCNIINYLHTLPESLLYLDIKPENIIILNDTCYLIDFGSVLYESEEPVTVFGTPSYASPEQTAGKSGAFVSSNLSGLADYWNIWSHTGQSLTKQKINSTP